MPDYKQGKIYALRSYKTTMIYIGSTTQTLSQRLGGHKGDYKRWLKTNKNWCSSFEIIKQGDCYIELIEYADCKTRAELRKKEGETIRKLDCVNKVKYVEGKTIEETKQYRKKWDEDNKERIRQREKEYRITKRKERYEYNKKWKQENREKYLKQRKNYYHKMKWKKKFNEVLKEIK